MGSMKVSPNMASRQSQLWFSVTSLIQYVRHDLKGGQENGEKSPAGGVKDVRLHCDWTRYTGAKSDNVNLQTLE